MWEKNIYIKSYLNVYPVCLTDLRRGTVVRRPPVILDHVFEGDGGHLTLVHLYRFSVRGGHQQNRIAWKRREKERKR